MMESTLALIKPHAFPRADEILSAITSAGFTITAKDVLSLTPTRAEQFYEAHPPTSTPSVPTADLVAALSAGPVMALVLSKADATAAWGELAGPPSPAAARASAPGSVRARFGVDGAKNAVHAPASAAAVEAQVAFFFPERERELPSGAAAKEYLMGSVVPSLTQGLTELCRVAPSDPLGWLAAFLGRAARDARGVDVAAEEGKDDAAAEGQKKDKQRIVFVLGGPGSGKVRVGLSGRVEADAGGTGRWLVLLLRGEHGSLWTVGAWWGTQCGITALCLPLMVVLLCTDEQGTRVLTAMALWRVYHLCHWLRHVCLRVPPTLVPD